MGIAILQKSILKVSGDNSKKLINGLITQNINLLTQETPIYALFLNNKGRVLYNAILHTQDNKNILIEIEPELLMDLAKHIHKYDLEKTCEFAQEEKYIAISKEKQENFYPDPRTTELPFRGIVENNTDTANTKELLKDYENIRLKLAIPDNYDFIREKSLANDLNTEELNGIDFKKGCYLGQEITSKTKHIKPTKNQLICLDNNIYNVKEKNLTIYKDDIKIGQTFSYNSSFVLAIIKRGTENLKELKIII